MNHTALVTPRDYVRDLGPTRYAVRLAREELEKARKLSDAADLLYADINANGDIAEMRVGMNGEFGQSFEIYRDRLIKRVAEAEYALDDLGVTY